MYSERKQSKSHQGPDTEVALTAKSQKEFGGMMEMLYIFIALLVI